MFHREVENLLETRAGAFQMTGKRHFERITRLLFGRRGRAATARGFRVRPQVEMVEGRTLLSGVGGVAGPVSDSAFGLIAGVTSSAVIDRRLLDVAHGGLGESEEFGSTSGRFFIGDFDGQNDLISVNADTNELTMTSGFDGPEPVTTTMSSGGSRPELAFMFNTGSGFDNLAVANTGNGVLSIFEGTSSGLVLGSRMVMPELRHASALDFLGVSGGNLWLYVVPKSGVGGVAEVVSLSSSSQPPFSNFLGSGLPLVSQPTPSSSGVAQLVPLQENSLALIGTLLPINSASASAAAVTSTGDVAAASATVTASPGAGSFGQSLAGQGTRLVGTGRASEGALLADNPSATKQNAGEDGWQHYLLGTKEALDQFDREHPELAEGGSHDLTTADHDDQHSAGDAVDSALTVQRDIATTTPSQDSETTSTVTTTAVDQVIDVFGHGDPRTERQGGHCEDTAAKSGLRSGLAEARSQLSACVLITTVGAGCLHFGAARKRRKAAGETIKSRPRTA